MEHKSCSGSDSKSSDGPWGAGISQSGVQNGEYDYALPPLPNPPKETTPLVSQESGRGKSVMVGTSSESTPTPTKSKIVPSVCKEITAIFLESIGCSRRGRCVLLSVGLFTLIFASTIVASCLTALSYCTSTTVYYNDVVYVTSIPGTWYEEVVFSGDKDLSSTTEFLIYYEQDPLRAQNTSNQSFTTKNFSFPQGLSIDNNQQNYFLKRSKITFYFLVENPSRFADLAKVCQFTSRADYEDITKDPPSNGTISSVERKGICKQILESPNEFDIERNGYYWYVLSTPLSPDDDNVNVRTSYEYSLVKVIYNTTDLGSPHTCTFLNGKVRECTISDSVFGQGLTKDILVIQTIPKSSDHYIVTITQRKAIGIALLTFSLLMFLFLTGFLFCLILFCVCKRCFCC